MPASSRCPEEVSEVLVQAAAHGRQRHRARGEDLAQAVHADPDQAVPAAQGLGLFGDPGAELTGQIRDHHVGPGQRHPAIGGHAVVRDAPVPLTGIGLADPQGGDRVPAQHGSGVDRLARRDAGEAPSGAGSQVARALAHDRELGAQHVPGRQQAAVQRHRLEIAAEGLSHRDRAVQPACRPQHGRGAGEPGRQRSAIQHDVGDPAAGRIPGPGVVGREHRRQRGMQVRDDHRHPAEVVGVAQDFVVGRALLVSAENRGLQRRVPGLNQVPGSVRVSGQPAGQRDDESVPAGAQAKIECAGIQQNVIAGFRAPGQPRVRQRAYRRPVHGHVKLDRAVPLAAHRRHDPLPPPDHAGRLALASPHLRQKP